MVELRGQTSEALAVVCAEREWACMYPVWRGMRVRCNVCLVLLGLFSRAWHARGRPARSPCLMHMLCAPCAMWAGFLGFGARRRARKTDLLSFATVKLSIPCGRPRAASRCRQSAVLAFYLPPLFTPGVYVYRCIPQSSHTRERADETRLYSLSRLSVLEQALELRRRAVFGLAGAGRHVHRRRVAVEQLALGQREHRPITLLLG